MNDNTTKQRDHGYEEYGKVRCPKEPDQAKAESGKVRESRAEKPISAESVTVAQAAATEKKKSDVQRTASPPPRPTVTAHASQEPVRRVTAHDSTRSRPRVRIPLPWIFGAVGALAAVTLIVFAVCFWSFGQWVFGIMTAVLLIAIALWIYHAFDGYVPTIWIGFSLALLNVILFFILREDYDIMAMLISLGLAVLFFICVLYAYEDMEEGYGCFSGVLMSATLLFSTAAPGGVTLLWFFTCWMPGVLIALIISCLMMEVEDVSIFDIDLPDGCLQAIVVTVVTLLMHLLFEVISPIVIGLFTK